MACSDIDPSIPPTLSDPNLSEVIPELLRDDPLFQFYFSGTVSDNLLFEFCRYCTCPEDLERFIGLFLPSSEHSSLIKSAYGDKVTFITQHLETLLRYKNCASRTTLFSMVVKWINLKNIKSEHHTQLSLSLLNSLKSLIKIILKYDDNLNVKDAYGKTMLYYAIEGKDFECARLLIEYGACSRVNFEDICVLLRYISDAALKADLKFMMNIC